MGTRNCCSISHDLRRAVRRGHFAPRHAAALLANAAAGRGLADQPGRTPAPRLLPCPAAPLAGIEGLPEAASEEMLEDEDFLKAFHHALLEVHLEEGALVCPETGEEWDIKGG